MPSENVVVNKVIVHPLVLLSVVDHFNRMGKMSSGVSLRIIDIFITVHHIASMILSIDIH